MREFKFRVWDFELGEMMEWEEDHPRRMLDGHMAGILMGYDDGIIMQYTGLKDENRREIYEGDVVCDSVWGNGTVEFGDFSSGIDTRDPFIDAGYYIQFLRPFFGQGIEDSVSPLHPGVVIVGNIYENSNLLEGQNDIHSLRYPLRP